MQRKQQRRSIAVYEQALNKNLELINSFLKRFADIYKAQETLDKRITQLNQKINVQESILGTMTTKMEVLPLQFSGIDHILCDQDGENDIAFSRSSTKHLKSLQDIANRLQADQQKVRSENIVAFQQLNKQINRINLQIDSIQCSMSQSDRLFQNSVMMLQQIDETAVRIANFQTFVNNVTIQTSEKVQLNLQQKASQTNELIIARFNETEQRMKNKFKDLGKQLEESAKLQCLQKLDKQVFDCELQVLRRKIGQIFDSCWKEFSKQKETDAMYKLLQAKITRIDLMVQQVFADHVEPKNVLNLKGKQIKSLDRNRLPLTHSIHSSRPGTSQRKTYRHQKMLFQ